MSSAALTQLAIADEVTQRINASGSLASGVAAERHYQPNWELEDLQQMQVSVVPARITSTLQDRATERHDHQVEIAIQQKLTRGDNSEVDPLVELVGEIAALFRMQRLPQLGHRCTSVEHVVLFAPEHFDQYRVFTSLLRLTFLSTT